MSVSPEYWAGLFDGEGCVYISKNNRTNSVRGQFQVCVEVRMTSEEPIRLLKDEFGGTVCVKPAKPDKNWRESFSWAVRSLKAKTFLERIRPFTVVKSKQIDLAIEFQEIVSSRNHTGRISLSDEEYALRLKYYEELKHLKTVS